MRLMDVYWKKVSELFTSEHIAIRQLKKKKDSLSEMYERKCEDLDRSLEESLKVNEERREELNAFIKVAEMNMDRTSPVRTEKPYDKEKLNILSVQIMEKNDSYASSLYEEASAQLNYIKRNDDKLRKECEVKKKKAKEDSQNTEKNLKRERDGVLRELDKYMDSVEFKKLIQLLIEDKKRFCTGEKIQSNLKYPEKLTVGTLRRVLPVPKSLCSKMIKVSQETFDAKTRTLGYPVGVSVAAGSVVTAEYLNETESEILAGIQNLLLNIARYCGEVFDQICLMDPIRYNNSSLGCLAPLAIGENSFLDPVPLSAEEIGKKMERILDDINTEEMQTVTTGKNHKKRRILIFHNFPSGYSNDVVAKIRQLCAIAKNYRVTIILTHNNSDENSSDSKILNFIKMEGTNINCNKDGFFIEVGKEGKTLPFKWYSVPNSLPKEIIKKYIENQKKVDTSNDYEKRIGIPLRPKYQKGVRNLVNIPYGIKADGTILNIDFENTNFASFICGASRSGKSTLLHTLLTGIIESTHPDDVEIWLIDFKMTEFSRYIKHMPPHVRYIILDESPELVYDIIDRLTEILTKRQNMFKGRWEKLSDVPPEKYMPEIFVIIDEFSVMSEIMADSIGAKENYVIKMQTLLAKGAALGMRFIFASQGFTSGTRGLNDFSKKQIQQRIAMKTEVLEIKDTLDLKSASDNDRFMMEQIEKYHALVRVPMDQRGNHLVLSKVLYMSDDYKKQKEMIDSVRKYLSPTKKYDANDPLTYISKKPMVIDGMNYTSFLQKRGMIEKYMKEKSVDDDETILFIGEPRRMVPLYPIEIVDGFCENILMVASQKEKVIVASILMSITESLRMQRHGIEIWSSRKNSILSQLRPIKQKITGIKRDLEEICERIKTVKKAIENKEERKKFFVLLGFETLLMDMNYLDGQVSKNKSSNSVNSSNVFQFSGTFGIERKEGEENTIPRIGKILNSTQEEEEKNGDSLIYDARDDLKFILTQGPRLGYHFILVFNTVSEFNQTRIDDKLFKHNIFFQSPKSDVMMLLGSAEGTIVADLDSHVFRYTNGLNGLSFRPYLHNGLTWDGWEMDSDGNAYLSQEEEDYLQ